jgi:hypothetical protein
VSEQHSPHTPAFWQRRLSRRQALGAALGVLGGAALLRLPDLLAHNEPAAKGAPATALPKPSPAPRAALSFSGTNAMQHAAAQMQWVPRHPGTEGARLCGDYILQQLAAQGWDTAEQLFTYKGVNCRNLLGKRGSGPVLIIGAHYDTRRYADEDPDPDNHSLPVPGANDGASGIAVLLELARVLDPDALGRTIWLAAFDAEDNGRIDGWQWAVGSRYMAENLDITPQGMVLVDMIGDAEQQIYYERNSTFALSQGIWQVAADLGYHTFFPQFKYSIIDDHIPFLEQGIPAVDLIDFDYPYWHTIADTLDKISAASLEAVGRTLEQWLLQGAPGLPALPGAGSRRYLPFIVQGHFDNLPTGSTPRRA